MLSSFSNETVSFGDVIRKSPVIDVKFADYDSKFAFRYAANYFLNALTAISGIRQHMSLQCYGIDRRTFVQKTIQQC